MSKVLTETVLTTTQVAKSLNKTPRTIQRWITQGMHGHKLEATEVGGSFVTSEEALGRFSRAVLNTLSPGYSSGDAGEQMAD